MEQWSEIRHRVLVEGLSKRQACKIYNLHWHTLVKILKHSEPPGYCRVKPVRGRKIDPVLPVIHEILESDSKAPKKQRHSAKRIWERLRDEHGFTGKQSIVRLAVSEWRLTHREVFLPLSHPAGEAQVDFGFAKVLLCGVETEVALFVMSLPYSDAVYCQAFPRECTETFQEGHVRAFEFFGGVPKRIAYDNAKTTISQVLNSRDRKLTYEFLRLKSHYLFDSHFCLVRRPNEKGHVERLVDYVRSNFLVPVPSVSSLEELNAQLAIKCRQDQERTVRGASGNIASQLHGDQAAMLPLPAETFEARRTTTAHADSLSLIRFDTNSYSVPTKYAHRLITVIATVNEVKLIHEDQLVATHARCWDREETIYNPVHYLAILERKPGGFNFAKPLEQWELPECFGVLRRRLEADPQLGIKAYIRILRCLETHTLVQLTDVVKFALDYNVVDPDAICMTLDRWQEQPIELFKLDGRPQLVSIRVEATNVAAYSALLPTASEMEVAS